MLSIVVPVFDEKESLDEFYKRLKKVLQKTNLPYEVVFIDDGSTDNSLNILKAFKKNDKNIRLFSFRKNRGKAEALTLGFQKALGDYILTLDADLQDRPEEIPNFLQKAKEGNDVVCGWRRERKDQYKVIFASKFFNSLAKMFWGLQLHDYNCGFKLYNKEAAKSLFLYGGMYRFIPLFLYQDGFSIAEIAVQHEERKFGKSKYGFSKTWKDLPDIFTILFLTKYGKRPMHFFGFVGSAFSFVGIIFLGYLTYLHYFMHQSVGDRPLWTIGILFTLVGLQITFTGFLADLFINWAQNNKGSSNLERYLKYSSDKQ